MVARLLRLTEAPRPADATDALALAICHIWRGGAQARIEHAHARLLRARLHEAQIHEAQLQQDRGPHEEGHTVIAFVRGTVRDISPGSAVVEVGGVGLEVQCTPRTLATLRLGVESSLPTSMVVREDSLTLFGFLDADEKATFELVQTASGVGPKLAQAMIAVLSPEELRRAVAGEDVASLTRVPGVGQKGAQRIILELRDRIGPPGSVVAQRPGGRGATQPWRAQVHAGLLGLGWSAREADRAIETVAPEADDGAGADVAALLRSALQSLSKA